MSANEYSLWNTENHRGTPPKKSRSIYIKTHERYANSAPPRVRHGNSVQDRPPRAHRSHRSFFRLEDKNPASRNKSDLRSLANSIGQIRGIVDQIIVKRYQLDHEEQTLENRENDLLQSARNLIEIANSTLAQTNLEPGEIKCMPLGMQTQDDTEAFQHQALLVKQRRDQILQLEFRLKRQTDKLPGFLSSSAMSSPKSTMFHPKSFVSDSESERESSAIAMPPLLASYYDRKGDVTVFRERLQDLDYDYHDVRRARDLVTDRGDSLEVSEEQFNNEYIDRRQKILKDLDSAQRDTASLLGKCEAAGLQIPNDRRYLPSDTLSSSLGPSLGRIGTLGGHSVRARSPQIGRTASMPVGSVVYDWLQGVQHPDNDTGTVSIVGVASGLRQIQQRQDQSTSPAIFPQRFNTSKIAAAEQTVFNSDIFTTTQPDQQEDKMMLLRRNSDPSILLFSARACRNRDVIDRNRRTSHGDLPTAFQRVV